MMTLKEARRKRGFTQQELAKDLNITNVRLSQLETGKGYPSYLTAKKVETFLGLQIEWS